MKKVVKIRLLSALLVTAELANISGGTLPFGNFCGGSISHAMIDDVAEPQDQDDESKGQLPSIHELQRLPLEERIKILNSELYRRT